MSVNHNPIHSSYSLDGRGVIHNQRRKNARKLPPFVVEYLDNKEREEREERDNKRTHGSEFETEEKDHDVRDAHDNVDIDFGDYSPVSPCDDSSGCVGASASLCGLKSQESSRVFAACSCTTLRRCVHYTF